LVCGFLVVYASMTSGWFSRHLILSKNSCSYSDRVHTRLPLTVPYVVRLSLEFHGPAFSASVSRTCSLRLSATLVHSSAFCLAALIASTYVFRSSIGIS